MSIHLSINPSIHPSNHPSVTQRSEWNVNETLNWCYQFHLDVRPFISPWKIESVYWLLRKPGLLICVTILKLRLHRLHRDARGFIRELSIKSKIDPSINLTINIKTNQSSSINPCRCSGCLSPFYSGHFSKIIHHLPHRRRRRHHRGSDLKLSLSGRINHWFF